MALGKRNPISEEERWGFFNDFSLKSTLPKIFKRVFITNRN
jgi:hypothetical protein